MGIFENSIFIVVRHNWVTRFLSPIDETRQFSIFQQKLTKKKLSKNIALTQITFNRIRAK